MGGFFSKHERIVFLENQMKNLNIDIKNITIIEGNEFYVNKKNQIVMKLDDSITDKVLIYVLIYLIMYVKNNCIHHTIEYEEMCNELVVKANIEEFTKSELQQIIAWDSYNIVDIDNFANILS